MNILLNLEGCNEGMSCEEYTTMMVAGIRNCDIPQDVQDRMTQHEEACGYHQSSAFYQSVLGTPVTEEIEQGAWDIIKKYAGKEVNYGKSEKAESGYG